MKISILFLLNDWGYYIRHSFMKLPKKGNSWKQKKLLILRLFVLPRRWMSEFSEWVYKNTTYLLVQLLVRQTLKKYPKTFGSLKSLKKP